LIRAKKCDNTGNWSFEDRIDMTNLPKFSAALLHPRYWLTWLGIGILWLIVQLPYPILFKLGCALGRLALRLMKRRAKIVSRNLELCFPQMSEQERQQMVVKNFESVGMGVMETGMAWFWSDKRISRWTEVIGMEHIRTFRQKRGILLVGLLSDSGTGCASVWFAGTGYWCVSP
jgi:KDO2-lipid IV(A) lauroyltransferase